MTQIHKLGGNIVVPLTDHIGFGIPSVGDDSVGPRILATDGDPSGLPAPVGSFALDYTTPTTWQATDAIGGWAQISSGGQVFASIVDSAPRINGAGNTPFDVSYTIPANTLIAGSTVRVRAVVRITAANGATLELIGRASATPDVPCSASGLTAVAVGTTAMVEWWFTTRAAPGAAVDTVGGGFAIFTTIGGGGAAVGASSTMANGVTLATNAPITVDMTATWSVGDNSSCFLESLIVDIF